MTTTALTRWLVEHAHSCNTQEKENAAPASMVLVIVRWNC